MPGLEPEVDTDPAEEAQAEAARQAAAAAANAAKEEGNSMYKDKDYDGALRLYTRAIQLEPTNHTFYSNRAATYLALKQYRKAIADCEKALELKPLFVKAHLRAGKAHLLLVR